MILVSTLYDVYIDRPKLTEQKKPVEYIVPPPSRGVETMNKWHQFWCAYPLTFSIKLRLEIVNEREFKITQNAETQRRRIHSKSQKAVKRKFCITNIAGRKPEMGNTTPPQHLPPPHTLSSRKRKHSHARTHTHTHNSDLFNFWKMIPGRSYE